jgi:HSP20 family protein
MSSAPSRESNPESPPAEESDLFHDVRSEMRAMEEDLGFVRSRLRALFDPWAEGHGGAGRGHDLALAAVDLEDLGTHYEVRFDLPGIPKERVSVKVVGQRVEVRAEAPAVPTGRRVFLVRERAHRGYERTVELPAPVIATEVRATVELGVLTVSIPKTRQAAEHRIAIT